MAVSYLKNRGISTRDHEIVADWHIDGWSIHFYSNPPTPGGDFTVQIPHDGSAIELIPGW